MDYQKAGSFQIFLYGVIERKPLQMSKIPRVKTLLYFHHDSVWPMGVIEKKLPIHSAQIATIVIIGKPMFSDGE